MAIVVTNNYFRNAFSAGSKPRILIEIGRDYDETRGHFKYPTFFRNFCYGGDLRIHNIHIQESAATPISSDNNVLLYDHVDTSLLVNSENMSRIYSTASYDFDTSGSIQGIDNAYYKPRGVFTRGDTIELLDRNTGAFVDRSFIVGGSESGTTGVKKNLFSGDINNRLFIKTPADISSVNTGYAYTINRDYFDEVTSPPVFQNSIDRLGGFASSGSVSFSLSNIKSPNTRQNWQQNTNEGLSDFWSQFLYNQTGDMLDNIQSIDDDWGIENSEVKIYMIYCEDTIYRGKCKITRTGVDKITQLYVSGSDYHKWTLYDGDVKLLKSTDKLILHNKVSDGSVDANCRSHTIDPSETNYNSINIGDNFTVGSDDDEYYYSIKRKDSMSWEDYYTGRMLMFNGKITTVSGISKTDITFVADSKSYIDIKDKTFGWEKIDSTITDHGVNFELNGHGSDPILGISNDPEYERNSEVDGKTMPILFGDARLYNIHANLTSYDDMKADPNYGDYSSGQGVWGGIKNYLTPIEIGSASNNADGHSEFVHTYDSHFIISSSIQETNSDNVITSQEGLSSGYSRNTKLRAFLVSKYPMFCNETYSESDKLQKRWQRLPSRISGELTLKSGDVRGMLFPQRFRSNDNCSGTVIWAHTEDSRSADEKSSHIIKGSCPVSIQHSFTTSSLSSYVVLRVPIGHGIKVGDIINISDTTTINCSGAPVVKVYATAEGTTYQSDIWYPDTGIVILDYGNEYLDDWHGSDISFYSNDGGHNTGYPRVNNGQGKFFGSRNTYGGAIIKVTQQSGQQVKFQTNVAHDLGDIVINDDPDGNPKKLHLDILKFSYFEDSYDWTDGDAFAGENLEIDSIGSNYFYITFPSDVDVDEILDSALGDATSWISFWCLAGDSSCEYTKVSNYSVSEDIPHTQWCLLPSDDSRTGDSLINAKNTWDWKSDPNLSDYSTLEISSNSNDTGNSSYQVYNAGIWKMQSMPGISTVPHYWWVTDKANFNADLSSSNPDIKKWQSNSDMFHIFCSSFQKQVSVSDYEGWNNVATEPFAGLTMGYVPKWATNIEGVHQIQSEAMGTTTTTISSSTVQNKSGSCILSNQYLTEIGNKFYFGMRSDNEGNPVNEGNIDPKIYLYFFKLHIDTWHAVSPDMVVYNGYGSPVGDWCKNRNVSDGFDETHIDNSTERVAYSTAGTITGQSLLGHGYIKAVINRFGGAGFSAVEAGDILIMDKNVTGGFSGLTGNDIGEDYIGKLRTKSGTKMDGLTTAGVNFTDGRFSVSKNSSTSLNLFDTPELVDNPYFTNRTQALSGYIGGTAHWNSTTNSSTYAGSSDNDWAYSVFPGKACLNPMTQLEQLLRWELFWDSTAIDENSFNTASNDRSAWEGWLLIEEEVEVQGWINTWCKNMGVSSWITANGKLKVKAPNVTDPYSATQVNSRAITGTTVSSGNAPTETLNMCSSDPHVGFKFDFDYKYQCSVDELSTMRLYETNSGTSVYANFTSADNTNDPITAASKLAAKLTADSPTGWTYTVIFDYDTQKFTIDAGSGHTIYAIGEVATDETGHDSLCNLFGFYKVYRTVGARTLTSDFPISTLPIHGHMIVKDSFAISKSSISTLANEITVKYNAGEQFVTVSDASSISTYGTMPKTYENFNIVLKDTATLYANFLLDKLSVPKITVNFAIAGASGIVFEVSDYICISHELLQSIYGKTYNSHGGGVNSNTKFRILSTSYGVKSNKVQIVAEEV